MALQTNNESSYIQAASNRLDTAIPRNAFVVSPSGDAFEESVLYIDDADVLTIETAGGQTVSMSLSAGFVPVRVVKVTAQTGTANIFRLN
jgi:hypothetical protein